MHSLLEKEHKQLIDLLDALDQCLATGNSKNEVHKYMDTFVVLATKEFKKEEELMETYEYKEAINHEKEHAELLEQLFVLKNKLDSGHTPFGKEYMQSLRSWLEKHLYGADNRFDKFLHEIDTRT